MSMSNRLVVNGWELFNFILFAEILNKLEQDVTRLKQTLEASEFKRHPKAKLLASVFKIITSVVPRDPNDKQYQLGNTLGSKNRSFRRVKKSSLPPRHRLFFKFSSEYSSIIYIWINDDSCLRKDGDKTDVYNVFKKMIHQGQVPKSYQELLKQASPVVN